ncbi:MAG: AMP-binding protein [Planctomycetota bacterium]
MRLPARTDLPTTPAVTTSLTDTPARPRFASLVELLSWQAARHDDAIAFRYIDGGDAGEVSSAQGLPTPSSPAPVSAPGGGETLLTFSELDLRARAIGAELAQRLRPGDRALLVYPPGLEFISAFFGCLYAGVVATPATYPKPRRPLPRMSRIAEDSGAAVALTTSQTLATIDFDQQDATARSLAWLATDDLPAADAGWRPHDAGAGDLAFLQYTSGSTSEPKGVMVTHGNLLANLEAIRVAFGLGTEPTAGDANAGVFWLPAYHDMGLIGGVLTPLYVGGPSVLMPPPSFLQRPLRWLEAVDRFKATISGAPDFAYRLCVDRTNEDDRGRLDLSAWRVAFCGAEPIHAATLTAFADAFSGAGFNPSAFYPCYGLAEATLLAAGPDWRQPPSILSVDRAELRAGHAVVASADRPAQELVGCGRAPRGHGVLVADPESLTPRGEQAVGELLVRGPSVTGGYWRRDAETAESFGLTVPGEPGAWMRTGDLGFTYRGELFVTGRVKDVIIVRGRNYYPQDIEQTAEAADPAVLPGAAFSVEWGADPDRVDPDRAAAAGEERLVLVCQIDRSCRDGSRPALVDAIRRAVLTEHEIDPAAVVLIRQGSLPVTSSGKVQRSLCRDRYQAGELTTLHAWQATTAKAAGRAAPAPPELAGLSIEAAAERIEEWMLEWLVDRADLEVTASDRDRPFAELGLDSLTAVELSGELEQAIAVPLPPIIAWNHPTPAALARYLAEQSRPAADAAADAATRAADGDADIEALLADIENLTDEEARRLLSEE